MNKKINGSGLSNRRHRAVGQTVLVWLAVMWVAVATAAPAGSPAAASFNPGWTALMLAKRAALQVDTVVKESPWRTTGPLKAKSFSEALFPEHGVDLDTMRGNRKVWQAKSYANGVVHELQAGDGTASYFYRTLIAQRAGKLRIGLGSDDGIEFWFNGQKLLSKNPPRGVDADQDIVTVDLRPGTNEVLLKVFNQGGACGFYYNAGNSVAGALAQIAEQYPREARLFSRYASAEGWFQSADDTSVEQAAIAGLLQRLQGGEVERQKLTSLVEAKTPPGSPEWLNLLGALAVQADGFERAQATIDKINLTSLRLAVEDLSKAFPDTYPGGAEFLKAIQAFEQELPAVKQALARGDKNALGAFTRFEHLQRTALLANPLLNFDRLLLVKRDPKNLGLPQNWQGNCAVAKTGYDNEIAVLSPVRPDGKLTPFYQPEGRKFVGDVDLDFDAGKLLFSSIGSHNRWQIFELKADGTGLRQLTPADQPDVDNYDPCYLPSGKIIFGSTACFHGVPCVGGGDKVANLYLMDRDGKNLRRLTFDQDHDWTPAVMNNGRVLYTRWEYSDTPHYFTRVLFHMNPDGTDQREYLFSNSYWPNSTFYARPIPGHPTKVVAIISGHHGVPRMGELLVFEPATGRREAEAVAQRIPGYGKKVPPTIADGLVEGSWPKFLHPYPLSEKYFLVSCKPSPQSHWGIYLVDLFDNFLLLAEEPGYALLEPVPFRATPRPPVIPDKVNLAARDATMFIADVYTGPGLAGVPRGTVKSLRLYSFHYAYPGMGGHIHIGIDGPWDARRILGTVPVETDGSAMFRVPANTPMALQPLDAQGRALQVMRSWTTAMPGEKVSCIGCHEPQNTTFQPRTVMASLKPAAEITPWYGPERPFGFMREVQPVLDRYCVGCHDGTPNRPDLRAKKDKGWGGFNASYIALHPYVRRPGPESDYHLQVPLEWHASTSDLVQMLEKGHHNVQLDREAWDRLNTWIDLNVPDHSTWSEHRGKVGKLAERRRAMDQLTSNLDVEPEAVSDAPLAPVAFIKPAGIKSQNTEIQNPPGWPFDAAEAKRRQAAAGRPPELKISLSNGLTLDLVLIPAGEFLMGDTNEPPVKRVRINKPFYMGKQEILNGQYRLFDSSHDSGYISGFKKDQSDRGQAVNQDRQPVIRVSWQQAMQFCEWLTQKSGRRFSLPTEEEWEYACRAGTATPMNFGAEDADFGKFANLADRSVLHICRGDPQWIPCVNTVQDGSSVTSVAGRYAPNAWGLGDMHGNAAEWTLSDGGGGKKIVRGGSFYDRPSRARSAYRLSYEPWQRVFNVGFRVVLLDEPAVAKLSSAR